MHLHQLKKQGGDNDATPSLEYHLFEDCTLAQLLDPDFAGDVVNFCMLQVCKADPSHKSTYLSIATPGTQA